MTEDLKIPCTVEVLTHNNGATLRRALKSVKEFAEIVVIDGNSTDDTLAIANEYGARIVAQDSRYQDSQGRISDFAGVRNQGLKAANQPWFFFLDSDEYLSEELVAKIRAITNSDREGTYRVSRRYVIDGVPVDCATTYPNYSMRFFARHSVDRFIKSVHERIQPKPDARCQTLTETLYVPFDTDILKIRRKWDYYIGLEAARLRPISMKQFLSVVRSSARASLLYFLRLIRNYACCRGVRMPLSVELERHRYHARLLIALWRTREGR